MGFFAKKGKLIAVTIIKIKCKTEEMRILLLTFVYLSLYGLLR